MIPIDIPQAAYVVDYNGTMTFDQARAATYTPATQFVYPNAASPLHPESIWIRFAPPRGEQYLVGAPGVGYAQVYFVQGGRREYTQEAFGMRIPYVQRAVQRFPPTAHIADPSVGSPIYVHVSLDDESRVTPILKLEDPATVAFSDRELSLMSSIALLFIGVFLSLAAANVFVYFFVREWPYVLYSILMLTNALFAATFVHGSSWRWLWPYASLPHVVVQATVVLVEALALLAFARAFLDTRKLVPKTDGIVLWTCVALLVLGSLWSYVLPSAELTPLLTARTGFIATCILYVIAVFWLGIAALRAGSVTARFFVASNGAVAVAGILVALSTVAHYDVSTTGNFVMLMNGQAVEGWLLFGALAYRLQQVIVRNTEEHRLATTDALTGIANRRTFDEALAREWDRCARSRSQLSLLMIDVDHFKKFNDTYGHIEGDLCLKRVAQAMRDQAVRPSDVCARYGGEEFAIVLPETDAKGALALGEQISQAVRALVIPHAASATGYVTVSIGGSAMIPYSGGAGQELVRAADAALYQAKESGRNRVFVR
jgi:diguanylate cyclase (GGDEF)-like protein